VIFDRSSRRESSRSSTFDRPIVDRFEIDRRVRAELGFVRNQTPPPGLRRSNAFEFRPRSRSVDDFDDDANLRFDDRRTSLSISTSASTASSDSSSRFASGFPTRPSTTTPTTFRRGVGSRVSSSCLVPIRSRRCDESHARFVRSSRIDCRSIRDRFVASSSFRRSRRSSTSHGSSRRSRRRTLRVVFRRTAKFAVVRRDRRFVSDGIPSKSSSRRTIRRDDRSTFEDSIRSRSIPFRRRRRIRRRSSVDSIVDVVVDERRSFGSSKSTDRENSIFDRAIDSTGSSKTTVSSTLDSRFVRSRSIDALSIRSTIVSSRRSGFVDHNDGTIASSRFRRFRTVAVSNRDFRRRPFVVDVRNDRGRSKRRRRVVIRSIVASFVRRGTFRRPIEFRVERDTNSRRRTFDRVREFASESTRIVVRGRFDDVRVAFRSFRSTVSGDEFDSKFSERSIDVSRVAFRDAIRFDRSSSLITFRRFVRRSIRRGFVEVTSSIVVRESFRRVARSASRSLGVSISLRVVSIDESFRFTVVKKKKKKKERRASNVGGASFGVGSAGRRARPFDSISTGIASSRRKSAARSRSSFSRPSSTRFDVESVRRIVDVGDVAVADRRFAVDR